MNVVSKIDIKENELDLVAKEEVKIWHEGYDNKLKKIAQDLEAEKIAEQEKLKEYKSNLNNLSRIRSNRIPNRCNYKRR